RADVRRRARLAIESVMSKNNDESFGRIAGNAPFKTASRAVRHVPKLLASLLFVTGCSSSSSPWEIAESPTEASLRKAWADDRGQVWAAGDLGTIVQYDGSSFRVENIGGTLHSVADIHGSSHDNIWAVGDGGLLVRYDGAAWTEQEPPIDD